MGVKAGALKSGCDYKLCILVVRGIFLSRAFPEVQFLKRQLYLILKGSYSECLSTYVTLLIQNWVLKKKVINISESRWTAGLLGPAFGNLKQATAWGNTLEMWVSG